MYFYAQRIRFTRADNIKVDHRFEMIRNVIVNSSSCLLLYFQCRWRVKCDYLSAINGEPAT